MTEIYETILDLGDLGRCDAICELELMKSGDYVSSRVALVMAWLYKAPDGKTDNDKAAINITHMLTPDALDGIAADFDEYYDSQKEDREVARAEKTWEAQEGR